MPYILPTAAPVDLVPFPTKIAPPLLRSSSSRGAVSTFDPNIDSNVAGNPLVVPRSRSRGTSYFTATSSADGQPDSDHSSQSSGSASPNGQSKSLRMKRMRNSQTVPPHLDFSANAENVHPSRATTVTSVPVKHEPINSGPGGSLILNLDAIKRTYSESQVTTPSVPTRLAASNSNPLIRKKSGEVVKSSLKQRRQSFGDTTLHSPVPKSPGASFLTTNNGPSSPPMGRVPRVPCKSAPPTPSSSKFVHFDTVEHVKLFLAEQKPLAVSRSGSPTLETSDFDTDTSATDGGRRRAAASTPSSDDDRFRRTLTVRVANASISQRTSLPPGMDVQLETVALSADAKDLRLNVLVRNVAFHKSVALRFTFDNWQTTSEVGARHVESVWSGARHGDPDYDRFACSVKIGDFGGRIGAKTMWAVVRYELPGSRQVWDNNYCQNYQIVFENKESPAAPVTASAPVRTEWSAKHGQTDMLANLRRKVLAGPSDNDDDDDDERVAGPAVENKSGGFGAKFDTLPFGRERRPWQSMNGVPFPSSKAKSGQPRVRGSQDDSHAFRNFRTMAQAQGSPRDLDDEEGEYRRMGARPRVDSDLQLDAETVAAAARRRAQPRSYFELSVLPAAVSWGFAEKKPGDATATPADEEEEKETPRQRAHSAPELVTPPILAEDAQSEDAPTANSDEPVLLDDRSRTSSSSSVSSGSWDAPPSPLVALSGISATGGFAAAAYGSALSALSTPSIASSESATTVSSPLDSPASPAEYSIPFALDPTTLGPGFGLGLDDVAIPLEPALAMRTRLDASNYDYFLNRFCFYTGKNALAPSVQPLRPEEVPRRASSFPTPPPDDYFGAVGSPPLGGIAVRASSLPVGESTPLGSSESTATLCPSDSTATLIPSGRSTPTTPTPPGGDATTPTPLDPGVLTPTPQVVEVATSGAATPTPSGAAQAPPAIAPTPIRFTTTPRFGGRMTPPRSESPKDAVATPRAGTPTAVFALGGGMALAPIVA